MNAHRRKDCEWQQKTGYRYVTYRVVGDWTSSENYPQANGKE